MSVLTPFTAVALAIMLIAVAVAGRVRATAIERRLRVVTRRTPLDTATGMFAPPAAAARLEVEFARAERLQRRLLLWTGRVRNPHDADVEGSWLRGALPGEVVGVRLAERLFCVANVSHVELGGFHADRWHERVVDIAPGDQESVEHVLADIRTWAEQQSDVDA